MAHQGFTRQTQRLLLREFSPEDAEPLFRLNSDPKVLRYTGDPPFQHISEAAAFIDGYRHYRNHGYGRWAVIDRSNETFMGFCGLRHNAADDKVDIGFRLFPRYWARGYATEAANAALNAGFHDFGMEEIIGRAMRENLPSITILQKLGMRFRSISEEEGLIWLIYVIDKASFDAKA